MCAVYDLHRRFKTICELITCNKWVIWKQKIESNQIILNFVNYFVVKWAHNSTMCKQIEMDSITHIDDVREKMYREINATSFIYYAVRDFQSVKNYSFRIDCACVAMSCFFRFAFSKIVVQPHMYKKLCWKCVCGSVQSLHCKLQKSNLIFHTRWFLLYNRKKEKNSIFAVMCAQAKRYFLTHVNG